MPDPSHVSLDGDRAVVVGRSFDAPRAHVWRAFTDPGLLDKWLLGPPGWDMHVCEMDLRDGGGYRWRWRNARSGEEFGFSGVYSVVEPERRICDRQSFDHGPDATPLGKATENSVTFEVDGAGTRVVTRVSYADAATRDTALAQGMTEGMELSYARLDALISELA